MLDKTMAEKNLYAVMDGDKGQKVCWSAEFGWDRWDLCHGVHGVCCNLQICMRALGFTASRLHLSPLPVGRCRNSNMPLKRRLLPLGRYASQVTIV